MVINVFDLLLNSYNLATKADDISGSESQIHRHRSQNFVNTLAKGFQSGYKHHPGEVRVFWSANSKNRRAFNRKEFLFDIAVCEVKQTSSATRRTSLPFISKPLWIVESEFERNSRAAIVDMSKLVMGQSENALFIGPHVGPKAGYMTMMGNVARHNSGPIYLAILEHPSKWKTLTLTSNIELYKWTKKGWSTKTDVEP